MSAEYCVLVTGSDGFVGRNLPYLAERDYKVTAASSL
jgi:nucleoside-diphosphate-sugar epimerase